MEKEFQDRIRSAMVIYQLEMELGRYAKNRHSTIDDDGTGKGILDRVGLHTTTQEENLKIVENSYLAEILCLCEVAAKGTSEERYLADLKDLFNKLDVWNIRNAISHPNRPFPEYLWYRSAALATDPVIQKLTFTDVVQAFQNALDGKIEPPPEDWLTRPSWSIPNNLPEQFEHSITGLVGREKDLQTLGKFVKNARIPLISVQAPGGVGKTSLVLEYLHDLCLTPEANSTVKFDAVIFVSLKQERLTNDGVQSLDAPSSIIDLKEVLSSQLSEIFGEQFTCLERAKQNLSSKQILLFVDNLETLLRDSPTYFDQLNEDLPSSWRIIVTSRIAVDGARNIPLDVLNKPGALHLARQYLHSRGQNTRDPSLIERITEGCKYNPLAIRLCIDSYIGGIDITDSISKTNENIAAFSFSKLLESLSEVAQKLLEAIFVLENPTRTELCESLSFDIDTVSASVGELGRTTLIHRKESETGERYSLSLAIRDLLRSRPNNLHIRSSVTDWLMRSKTVTADLLREQNKRGTLPIDQNYVPPGLPFSLIQICKPLDLAIRRNDYMLIGSIEQKLRDQITVYPTSSYLYRNFGRVQEAFNDYSGAISSLRKAVELSPDDPAANFSLATTLLKQEEFIEAENICKKLLELPVWEDNQSNQQYSWLLGTYLRALLYQEKLDEVFDITELWNNDKFLSEVMGVARASAYRRLVDRECKNRVADANRASQILLKAIQILHDLIRSHGYNRSIVAESRKWILNINFHINKEDLVGAKTGYFEEFTAFVKNHQRELKDQFDLNLQQAFNKVLSLTGDGKINGENNNIDSGYTGPSLSELVSKGFTKVKVSHIPIVKDGFPHYVFANDENDDDYFLHVSKFENGNWARWVFLERDVELAIGYVESSKGTARRKATEIYWP